MPTVYKSMTFTGYDYAPSLQYNKFINEEINYAMGDRITNTQMTQVLVPHQVYANQTDYRTHTTILVTYTKWVPVNQVSVKKNLETMKASEEQIDEPNWTI